VTGAGDVLVGRFVLRRLLGSGAFGDVYEAEDRRDGGHVALKILRETQPDWLDRFKREFRALQGLLHPNLVALDELFFDEGGHQWFFTMELLRGVDLGTHVRPDSAPPSVERPESSALPFDERKLRRALRQLLEGLAALHAADKVHRDIKPSNILVTHEGRVVLLDFGLVTEMQHSMSSAMVGTPLYMAPEQATGDVGPAADLYAVGVMLFELLTGRVPFEGTPLRIIMEKQTRRPPPPASIMPSIPDDLNALCVKLLHSDARRRPSVAEALQSLGTSRPSDVPPPPGAKDASAFVGRRAELDELDAALEATTRGDLQSVLVYGASGIGKSALVRYFTRQALANHPERRLLEGRCYEREAVPYKTLDGLVDALSRWLSRMPETEVAALLPARGAALALAFPVLLRVSQLAKDSIRLADKGEPHELRQRAFLALRELFTRIAVRQPTIVAIDDLQWADDDGLQGLSEILRPPDAPPLLFIGTVRAPGGSDAGLDRIRAAIPGATRVIELLTLGHEEAKALAATLLARGHSPDVAEQIATEGGGHPLFVEELARHVGLGRPSAESGMLDGAIWSRIAQLEPQTRAIAEIVAVAGRPLAQEVVAEAAGIEPAKFNRMVAILRASNLVRTGGSRWVDAIEPYHGRIGEAVLTRLEPARRRALHEALALAFEARSHMDPETLALHWREGGNASRAATYAVAAGDYASRTFAFDRAAQWYEQALDLLDEGHPTRRELHVRLGDALAFAGRGALAAPHFEIAAAESQSIEALELRRRAAEQLLQSGQFDRGVEATRVVLASIGMRIPKTKFATLATLALLRLRLALRGRRFRKREERSVTTERLTKIDTCWSFGIVLGFIDPVAGWVFLTRALLLALAAGEPERAARSLAMDVSYRALSGGRSRRRAERLFRYARGLADERSSAQARVFAFGGLGGAFYLNGRFREAAEHLERSLQLSSDNSLGLVHNRVTGEFLLLQSLAFLGRFRDLRRLHSNALRDARARGDMFAAVNLRGGFPSLSWLIEDRPDLAVSNAEAALAEWTKQGFHLEHFYARVATVWAKLYEGDVQAAHALGSDLLRQTRSSLLWRIQTVRLRALYPRGASALAMVGCRVGQRATLLAEAQSDALAIEREGMAWMQPFATALRAGIALHGSAREEAVRLAERAAREFDAQDMKGYARAALDRAARLRGDDSAAEEIAQIAAVFRAEEVVAPDRIVATLLPGLMQ
jgi:tetratricopeptide (TPR) repeat protein